MLAGLQRVSPVRASAIAQKAAHHEPEADGHAAAVVVPLAHFLMRHSEPAHDRHAAVCDIHRLGAFDRGLVPAEDGRVLGHRSDEHGLLVAQPADDGA